MQLVRAVAVDATGKFCILNHEADGIRSLDEPGEESGRIVVREPVDHVWKSLSVCGGDTEHRDQLEVSDHSPLVFGLLVVVRLGGKNPDGLLSLAGEPSVLIPGVEPGNVRGFVSLLSDEDDVVQAVAVEAALAVEVAPPLVRLNLTVSPLLACLNSPALTHSGVCWVFSSCRHPSRRQWHVARRRHGR